MIKESREKKGYTQEDAARKLDITLRHYQRIESYESFPSVIIAIKLSNLLGRSIELLWKDYIK
jgi:DNA-binding XRE family transcriptional regulator